MKVCNIKGRKKEETQGGGKEEMKHKNEYVDKILYHTNETKQY